MAGCACVYRGQLVRFVQNSSKLLSISTSRRFGGKVAACFGTTATPRTLETAVQADSFAKSVSLLGSQILEEPAVQVPSKPQESRTPEIDISENVSSASAVGPISGGILKFF